MSSENGHISLFERTASEIEESLSLDVANAWFPRCIDPAGGYHQNFEVDWSPGTDPARFLVFQSRMLWFTSQLAASRPEFRQYCEHGIRYFDEVLRGPDGVPKNLVANGEEVADHRWSYSLAFAIFGLSAAALATESNNALDLAKSTFTYLERFHKDPLHRGYFEQTDLYGNLAGSQNKGQNPHLHLLEAFTTLYQIWPDELVRQRLSEIVDFFIEDLFAEPGYLEDHLDSEAKVVYKGINFGHDLEVAHLLISATNLLRSGQERALSIARRLTDHSLAQAWDPVRGGFWGNRFADGSISETKIWWVQCEALLGLATLWEATGDPRYEISMLDQWAFIRDYQIDSTHRGLFESIDWLGKPSGNLNKGNAWKAAYHDGRAFLRTPEIIRRQAAGQSSRSTA